MKHKDFVRHLADNGCVLQKEAGKYSIFENQATKVTTPVSRHKEIPDFAAKKICKKLGIPEP
ncbi:MAG: type II toxin-antitoxin system HicA family toxin [Elusimicrobiota bacterium]